MRADVKLQCMAEIHILRTHALGTDAALQMARTWKEQAESAWGLRCITQEDKVPYQVAFDRPGVLGSLQVTADHFELRLTLGFLLSAYRGRIESELQRQLDSWLGAA